MKVLDVKELVLGLFTNSPNPDNYDVRTIGIELEYEKVHLEVPLLLPHVPYDPSQCLPWTKRWFGVQDNSLRNSGGEFVSVPLPITDVEKAVKELFSHPKSGKWTSSVRASNHVHASVHDFGVADLKALSVLYSLMEPFLFGQISKDREESIYCIPWYRGTTEPEKIVKMLNRKDISSKIKFRSFGENYNVKYTALYFGPISRIGTVEFRHAPSWTDENKICNWAHCCERIVSFAHGKTQQQIVGFWENNGNNFPEMVLGAKLLTKMTHIPKYESVVVSRGSETLAYKLLDVPDVDPNDPNLWKKPSPNLGFKPNVGPQLPTPLKYSQEFLAHQIEFAKSAAYIASNTPPVHASLKKQVKVPKPVPTALWKSFDYDDVSST